MNRVILYFILAFLISSCGEEFIITDCFPSQCGIPATVINLTSQAGCGLVFQLSDSSYLVPERRTYARTPSPEEDPIYYFDLQEGQNVKLGFRKSSASSSCTTGEVVFITCIDKVKVPAI